MTTGERVRKVREENGLTLREFGERLRVSNVAISLVENDKNNLSSRLAGEISRIFRVSEDWLTGKIESDDIVIADLPADDAAKFASDHNLDKTEEVLIREYLNLTDRERATFRKYLKKVLSELNGVAAAADQEETTDAIQKKPSEMTREEMHNAVDNQKDFVEEGKNTAG